MDEQRQYFRIDNQGEIEAYLSDGHPLEVVNISASGILLTNNYPVPPQGNVEIIVNRIKYLLHYSFLRSDTDEMVLIFQTNEDTDRLFMALKQIRDERRTRL